jgi:hypothetical protein
MASYHVMVGVGSDDEEVLTRTLIVSADSMDYDEGGVLEFSEGPAGSARLVAVFSPNVWMWAQQKGRVLERREDEE